MEQEAGSLAIWVSLKQRDTTKAGTSNSAAKLELNLIAELSGLNSLARNEVNARPGMDPPPSCGGRLGARTAAYSRILRLASFLGPFSGFPKCRQPKVFFELMETSGLGGDLLSVIANPLPSRYICNSIEHPCDQITTTFKTALELRKSHRHRSSPVQSSTVPVSR